MPVSSSCHNPIDGFDRVDVDRFAPPEKMFVGDCQRVENDQYRIVGAVGVERSPVERGPLLNQGVQRRIGDRHPPAFVPLATLDTPLESLEVVRRLADVFGCGYPVAVRASSSIGYGLAAMMPGRYW